MQSNSNSDENTLELAAWGLVQVRGADRHSFLQGQLTQDLDQLQAGTVLLAGWANAKGRLLCVAWMIEWQESVCLLMPAAIVAGVAKRLQMFVLRSKVEICTNDFRVTAVTRQKLPDGIKKSSYDDSISHCFYDDNHAAILPAQIPELALLINGGSAEDKSEQWQIAAIKAGLPVVRTTTSEEFVPQMLNLDLLNGISFTKGCYVGQEIVARTQNLGRIKRRMYGFSLPTGTSVSAGQPVYSGAANVGQVVDAARTDNIILLLAVIRISDLHNRLALDPEGHEQLQLWPLPYDIPAAI